MTLRKLIKRIFKCRNKKTYSTPSIESIDFTDPSLKGMKLHTRAIAIGKYEVNGVIFDAEDMIDANRKYLRRKKIKI